MIQGNKDRFKGAPWFGQTRQISLGGAGGISSWAYLLLARSNDHYIILVDPDIVEEHNLGGQFFKNRMVGRTKVEALTQSVKEFSYPPPKVTIVSKPIQEVTLFNTSDYIITGFDNMEARKYAYEKWKQNPNRKLFIDGRLLAEQFEVYFVTPDREEEYEKTLFDSSEESQASCTYKSTSHFAAMIAGVIVQGLNSQLANEALGDEAYHLPFKYYCFGPTFTIEIT
jgi:molybdopterin/thiamine biosynthesis adenylyltransferase